MTLSVGIIAAIIALLAWGFGDFFIQRAIRAIGSYGALFFIGAFGAVFFLPFIWSKVPTLFYPENLLILTITLAITFVGAVILFGALKVGKISVIEPVLSLEVLITLFISLFFLREAISSAQIGLIGLVFIGITMTVIHHEQKFWWQWWKKERWLERGVVLALVGALFSALMVLVQKGDEVIYFDPSYPLHLAQIHLTQAQPVFVSLKEDEGWTLDLKGLKNSINHKTKAIILTNPNNPTGTVLSRSEVEELADLVIGHNLFLILDEAYEFLVYENKLFSPMRIPELRERVVLCKSFSKEFAMTGWRIGYAFANSDTIQKINQVHTHFSISPPTPSIIAAIAALSDPRGKTAKAEFINQFHQSRGIICQRLDRLPKFFSYQKPAGAYYVFPKILGFQMSALEFAQLLVDEAHVVTIPGSSMGPAGAGHLRMSFAAKDDYIQKAFDRIDKFAKKHGLGPV